MLQPRWERLTLSQRYTDHQVVAGLLVVCGATTIPAWGTDPYRLRSAYHQMSLVLSPLSTHRLSSTSSLSSLRGWIMTFWMLVIELMMSYIIWSDLISSHPHIIESDLIIAYSVHCHSTLSNGISSYLTSFYPILFNTMTSHSILSYPIPPILFNPIALLKNDCIGLSQKSLHFIHGYTD